MNITIDVDVDSIQEEIAANYSAEELISFVCEIVDHLSPEEREVFWFKMSRKCDKKLDDYV